jgi:hypothetical protein
MSNPPNLVRALVIYAICVPLALALGYMLSFDIRNTKTLVTVAALFLLLLSPLLLKWHHPWLIASWNMSAIIFFVPGSPPLWLALAGMSMFLVVLRYTINQEQKIIHVASITWSLLALAVLVFIIAKIRGGLGLRSMGSDVYGAKRYFLIWGAILGYFAIVSQRIPPHKAMLYVTLFFLGGITMAVGSLLGLVSSSFIWLFYIFPPEYVTGMAGATTASGLMRSWSLAFMSLAVICALLARYGLTGTANFKHPWRPIAFIAFTFIGMMGGFRTMFVLLLLTCAILFYLEGLVRSRMFPAVLLLFFLGGALLMSGAAVYLPLSVQRSLAVLPVPIDPIAKYDALTSSEWRIQMWNGLLPQVPSYLLVGKGYLFDSRDADLAVTSAFRGASAQGSELVGDYHNGPLSVILPFGVPGVIIFCWFLYASLRVLYRNYKFGDPALLSINRFLFGFFLARTVFFLLVFGSLYTDIALFVGLLGLSVSINSGVAGPKTSPQPQKVTQSLPGPAVRRAVPGFAVRGL